MKNVRILAVTVLAALGAWSACSSGSTPEKSGSQPPLCVPGDQKECSCHNPDKNPGFQRCLDDGTYTDCLSCTPKGGGGSPPDGWPEGGLGGAGGDSGSQGGSGGTGGGQGGAGGQGGGTGGTCGAPLCDGVCCHFQTEICVPVPGGTRSACFQVCGASAECPPTGPCCALLSNGSGACMPNPTSAVPYQCRCTFGSDCSSGSCAPAVDSVGNPVGPYVCKPDDGQPYDGCNGALTFCKASGTCCFEDTNKNLFCASQCRNDSQCGSAHCKTYGNQHTSCSGALGCGP